MYVSVLAVGDRVCMFRVREPVLREIVHVTHAAGGVQGDGREPGEPLGGRVLLGGGEER